MRVMSTPICILWGSRSKDDLSPNERHIGSKGILTSIRRGGVSVGAEGAIAPTVSEESHIDAYCITFAPTVLKENRSFAN